MFGVTEADVELLTDLATHRAAAAAGIRTDGTMSISALSAELASRNQNLSNILMVFLEAYRNWFEFHRDLERRGSRQLSSEESQRHVEVVAARDATRKRFLEGIHEAETHRHS